MRYSRFMTAVVLTALLGSEWPVLGQDLLFLDGRPWGKRDDNHFIVSLSRRPGGEAAALFTAICDDGPRRVTLVMNLKGSSLPAMVGKTFLLRHLETLSPREDRNANVAVLAGTASRRGRIDGLADLDLWYSCAGRARVSEIDGDSVTVTLSCSFCTETEQTPARHVDRSRLTFLIAGPRELPGVSGGATPDMVTAIQTRLEKVYSLE